MGGVNVLWAGTKTGKEIIKAAENASGLSSGISGLVTIQP